MGLLPVVTLPVVGLVVVLVVAPVVGVPPVVALLVVRPVVGLVVGLVAGPFPAVLSVGTVVAFELYGELGEVVIGGTTTPGADVFVEDCCVVCGLVAFADG